MCNQNGQKPWTCTLTTAVAGTTLKSHSSVCLFKAKSGSSFEAHVAAPSPAAGCLGLHFERGKWGIVSRLKMVRMEDVALLNHSAVLTTCTQWGWMSWFSLLTWDCYSQEPIGYSEREGYLASQGSYFSWCQRDFYLESKETNAHPSCVEQTTTFEPSVFIIPAHSLGYIRL